MFIVGPDTEQTSSECPNTDRRAAFTARTGRGCDLTRLAAKEGRQADRAMQAEAFALRLMDGLVQNRP